MSLRGSVYIGWRYLDRHRRKTTLLVSAITISLFLPLGILLVVHEAEQHLRARSASTPLVFGAPGSPLELVFNTLYFAEPEIATITIGTARAAGGDGLADVVPIHARFEARGARIVGTTLEYFRFRGLRPAEGRLFTRLGDCVLGAAVAASLGLAPGDTIVSTPEQVFDLAGVYPLKMRVTGILEPNGTTDDRAVFCDVRTTWIIEGLAHGHQEADDANDDTVLAHEDGNVVMNASVVEYTEVTDDNADSFHFHGDPDAFPITGAVVRPRDRKAETILLGRYVGDRTTAQLVRPDDVMANLFATVFRIRDLVVAALLAVGAMAAVITLLVFALSNRLRAAEFESLASIGADRSSVRLLLAFEAVFVFATSIGLAALAVLALNVAVPRLLPILTS